MAMSAPDRAPRLALQEPRCADREVGVLGHTVRPRHAPDDAVVADRESQAVAVIDEPEDALQFVIAVGPPAGDVQEEVELRRRGIVGTGEHAPRHFPPCQFETMSFTLRPARSRSTRFAYPGKSSK
jgi:hypothetical protein